MPTVTLLGSAQDGGVPQVGCSCTRCMDVHMGKSEEQYPVSLGIKDDDGKYHIIEASRTLGRQLRLWAESTRSLGEEKPICGPIQSVTLTHLHLGHVDGVGLFGTEVMGCRQGSIRLISGKRVIEDMEKKSYLKPFTPEIINNGSKVAIGAGVDLEFVRVPHREEECSETYGIIVRGKEKSIFFLPDHDTYDETLKFHAAKSIKEWLCSLEVDVALLDGTFFTVSEVAGRRKDVNGIPHPPIAESLEKLGMRDEENDPEIYFIHINHTNPVLDNQSNRDEIHNLKWGLGEQGQSWLI